MKENINKNEGDEAIEREYFFPAHNLNIMAVSTEEANKKLEEHLKALKVNK